MSHATGMFRYLAGKLRESGLTWGRVCWARAVNDDGSRGDLVCWVHPVPLPAQDGSRTVEGQEVTG